MAEVLLVDTTVISEVTSEEIGSVLEVVAKGEVEILPFEEILGKVFHLEVTAEEEVRFTTLVVLRFNVVVEAASGFCDVEVITNGECVVELCEYDLVGVTIGNILVESFRAVDLVLGFLAVDENDVDGVNGVIFFETVVIEGDAEEATVSVGRADDIVCDVWLVLCFSDVDNNTVDCFLVFETIVTTGEVGVKTVVEERIFDDSVVSVVVTDDGVVVALSVIVGILELAEVPDEDVDVLLGSCVVFVFIIVDLIGVVLFFISIDVVGFTGVSVVIGTCVVELVVFGDLVETFFLSDVKDVKIMLDEVFIDAIGVVIIGVVLGNFVVLCVFFFSVFEVDVLMLGFICSSVDVSLWPFVDVRLENEDTVVVAPFDRVVFVDDNVVCLAGALLAEVFALFVE